MGMLAAAAAAFLLLHLLVSGTRLRDALVGALGERAYMGLFSIASIALIIWLIVAFGGARASPANAVYWRAIPATRAAQFALQLIAFLLIVPGLTTPNPTSVAQQTVLDRPDAVRGMLRITRHPFLWGVAIWAAGHILVAGTTAALILFGSLLVLAVAGTASIDAKRRRALGERWTAFADATSSLPFAAIARGRQSLNIGEIGAWRLVLAVILWAVAAWAHPWIAGVRALP